MRVRLTEKHPLDIKLRKLEDYMNENGITLEWNGYNMVFKDENESAYLKDNDNGEPCMEVPYICENKLVQED